MPNTQILPTKCVSYRKNRPRNYTHKFCVHPNPLSQTFLLQNVAKMPFNYLRHSFLDEFCQIVQVSLVGMSGMERSHRASAGKFALVNGNATSFKQGFHLWIIRFHDCRRRKAYHLANQFGREGFDVLFDFRFIVLH